MEATAFSVEYHTDTPELTDALKAKLEMRLQKLLKRHHDVTGASLAVKTLTGKNGTAHHRYRVRLVVYQRPENVAAAREDDHVSSALQEVIDAVERQVRERRERQRSRSRRA